MACHVYDFSRDAQLQATVTSSSWHKVKALVLYRMRAKRARPGPSLPLSLSYFSLGQTRPRSASFCLTSLLGRPGHSLPLSVLLLSWADQGPSLPLYVFLLSATLCIVQHCKIRKRIVKLDGESAFFHQWLGNTQVDGPLVHLRSPPLTMLVFLLCRNR
jgi:hypothetical protein